MAMVSDLDMPFYLLAPEVAVLFSYIDDLRQLAFFDVMWNTGARPNEALAIKPQDIELEGPQPFVVLRTLKQRLNRKKGRPRKDEMIRRAVPILDPAFTRRLRQLLASFPVAQDKPIWSESPDTIARWLSRALDRAKRDGVTFTINNITPKTLRHSFAMHVLSNGIHPKRLQAYMGHKRPESTEVYTKVFALDVSSHQNVSFGSDIDEAAALLLLRQSPSPDL